MTNKQLTKTIEANVRHHYPGAAVEVAKVGNEHILTYQSIRGVRSFNADSLTGLAIISAQLKSYEEEDIYG